MILEIHHIQITIPTGSEEQARCFYCKLLGLLEVTKPQVLQHRGGFWLQVGDRQVHVGTEEGVDRHATKAHVAYQVSNLEHWRQELENSGITLSDSLPIPGYQRFEFRDPFGNRVEMIQEED